MAAKREGAAAARGGRRGDLSYGLEGGPLAMPLSVGQKQVARVHPLSGVSGARWGGEGSGRKAGEVAMCSAGRESCGQ